MRILFLIFLLCKGLGCFAQSYVLDTTFQPFFDFTDQHFPKPLISFVYESPSNSRIYVLGTFKEFYNQTPHWGSTCFIRSGGIFPNYNNVMGNYSAYTLIRVDRNLFYIGNGASNGSLIDSLGNIINKQWRNNYLKSVKCRIGIPFFYQDGSSLFANSSDNSGQPCDIINPPDTFPGRHIIKLTPEGLWDSTFMHDANYQPRGFFPYDSSRILVYGYPERFTHYDGIRVDGLCRIFLDGTLDTTFHSPLDPNRHSQFFDPYLVEGDGSFFIVGSFYLKGENNKQTLVKLDADGSLDNNFLNFRGPTDSTLWNIGVVRTIVKTEDSGYLVGGRFNNYQDHEVHSIAKLDSTGKLEPHYFPGSGPDSSSYFGTGHAVVIIILQSKFGGYYVGGDFLKWDGKPSQPIVRLKLVATTGMMENELSQASAKVFPNPAKGTVNIKSELPIEEIKLFDTIGKMQLVKPKMLSTKKFSINIQSLQAGIYLLSIQLKNGQTVSKKLVKK